MWPLYPVLALLIVASYYDIREREVPSKLMYITVIVAVLSSTMQSVFEGYASIHILVYAWTVNIIILLSTALLVRLGMLGSGDLVALVAVAAATATKPLNSSCVFPLLFASFTYAVAGQALLALGILVYNLVKVKHLSKLPIRLRLVYMFTAIPVKAEKAVAMKGWWYPLTFCNKMLIGFNVNADPDQLRRMLEKDIEKGCIRPDDIVWVSYGLPALPFIAAGVAASLIVGDKPLLALVEALARVKLPCIG